VNWYLNPNMRIMFNWIHAMPDKPDYGNADIFLGRFQADF
jgi:phosphate-selective porin